MAKQQDLAPAATGGMAADIHATGQPDTPVEVLTHLLQTALQQSTLQDTHCSVHQALDIVAGASQQRPHSPPAPRGLCNVLTWYPTPAAGLDPYLESHSSQPPQVVHDLIQASLEHDWAAVHAQVGTQPLGVTGNAVHHRLQCAHPTNSESDWTPALLPLCTGSGQDQVPAEEGVLCRQPGGSIPQDAGSSNRCPSNSGSPTTKALLRLDACNLVCLTARGTCHPCALCWTATQTAEAWQCPQALLVAQLFALLSHQTRGRKWSPATLIMPVHLSACELAMPRCAAAGSKRVPTPHKRSTPPPLPLPFVPCAGAKRVLEVGMFTGTSSLAMAEALPDDGQVGRAGVGCD